MLDPRYLLIWSLTSLSNRFWSSDLFFYIIFVIHLSICFPWEGTGGGYCYTCILHTPITKLLNLLALLGLTIACSAGIWCFATFCVVVCRKHTQFDSSFVHSFYICHKITTTQLITGLLQKKARASVWALLCRLNTFWHFVFLFGIMKFIHRWKCNVQFAKFDRCGIYIWALEVYPCQLEHTNIFKYLIK